MQVRSSVFPNSSIVSGPKPYPKHLINGLRPAYAVRVLPLTKCKMRSTIPTTSRI